MSNPGPKCVALANMCRPEDTYAWVNAIRLRYFERAVFASIVNDENLYCMLSGGRRIENLLNCASETSFFIERGHDY